MKKFTKIGAIIGGAWGLITGVLYAWGVFAAAFSHHTVVGIVFEKFHIIWKFIYLPAYLTDQILSVFVSQLLSFFPHLLGISSILWILIFTLFFVGIPLFVGSIFGAGIGYLIDKLKKQ